MIGVLMFLSCTGQDIVAGALDQSGVVRRKSDVNIDDGASSHVFICIWWHFLVLFRSRQNTPQVELNWFLLPMKTFALCINGDIMGRYCLTSPN